MENVPVVDLAGDHVTAVQTVDAALRRYGFFYVQNHGVDPNLIQAQFDAAAKLFALPQAEKEAMPFDAQLDIGYVGQGIQSLNPDGTIQITGDTKEQIMMTNNKLITAAKANTTTVTTAKTDPHRVFEGSRNYTPKNIPGYAETTQDYASALFRLNQQLNRLLFDALALDDATKRALGEEPFVVLKQMRYAGDLSDPERGKFGAGAHTDWGSFTILATDTTPGLEIAMDDNDDDDNDANNTSSSSSSSITWLPVPPKPNCFIINSGDQIAQLTNNYYRSANHRVVTQSTKPRFSTAFFTYFGIQATVAPLAKFVSDDNAAAYAQLTTLEYFHFKLHQSMGVSS